MLGKRIVTAVVLICLLILTLKLGPWAFNGLVAVLAGAAVFEGARLVKVSVRSAWVSAIVGGCACFYSLLMAPASAWLTMTQALFVPLLCAWAYLTYRIIRDRNRGLASMPSWLVVLIGGTSLLSLIAVLHDLLVAGRTVALFSALSFVWIADSCAYFVGRTVGGPKLAPGISPGKTCSGVIGGMVFVIASVLVARCFYPNADWLPLQLLTRYGSLAGIGWVVVLVFISVAGDLWESSLKRAAGVKDSGIILPGHGGVLDRIDALLPTVPLLFGVAMGYLHW